MKNKVFEEAEIGKEEDRLLFWKNHFEREGEGSKTEEREVEVGCITLKVKPTKYGHYDFLLSHSFHHFAPFFVYFLALSYWLGVGIEGHMFGQIDL